MGHAIRAAASPPPTPRLVLAFGIGVALAQLIVLVEANPLIDPGVITGVGTAIVTAGGAIVVAAITSWARRRGAQDDDPDPAPPPTPQENGDVLLPRDRVDALLDSLVDLRKKVISLDRKVSSLAVQLEHKDALLTQRDATIHELREANARLMQELDIRRGTYER